MSVRGDVRILWNLATRSDRGATHAERLENFYSNQAEDYDRFRRRLLPGREALAKALSIVPGTRWVDLGGGTGWNVETMGRRAARCECIDVVDLCPPLLEVARRRFARLGLPQAHAIAADATTYRPAQPADVVTFSYALSMIPDWFRAVDNAVAMLRPGGTLAVADFYVGRKHPAPGRRRHGWFTRHFWPTWFAWDNVQLSPDLLPFLESRFEVLRIEERFGSVPYMPGSRVPWFLFIGRKAAGSAS